MIFDEEKLDRLSREAAASPRLRMNLDLRDSAESTSQRMLNAMEPGTVLPIHRHPATAETLVVIRGAVEQIFFDNDGRELDRVRLEAGKTPCCVNVPAGQWHRTVSLLPGTVIFEAKEGSYAPLTPADILPG